MKIKAIGKIKKKCYFCHKEFKHLDPISVIDTPDGRQPAHAYHHGVMDLAVDTMLDAVKENLEKDETKD